MSVYINAFRLLQSGHGPAIPDCQLLGLPGTDGPETTLGSQETDVHQANGD